MGDGVGRFCRTSISNSFAGENVYWAITQGDQRHVSKLNVFYSVDFRKQFLLDQASFFDSIAVPSFSADSPYIHAEASILDISHPRFL